MTVAGIRRLGPLSAGNCSVSAAGTVNGSIGSLNVRRGVTFNPTPDVLFGGSTSFTDGVVVSLVVPVVNVKLPGFISGFSETSVIWLVATMV